MDNWTNKDNAPFYESAPITNLCEVAHMAGLSDGCDLRQIKSYILHSKTILEVGGGFGRVITHLRNMGYNGELYALERNKKGSPSWSRVKKNNETFSG